MVETLQAVRRRGRPAGRRVTRSPGPSAPARPLWDAPAHPIARFAAVYAVFVLTFAALRPAFLAREPDAFPVLGN